jgi:hypothetical protein
MTSDLNKPVRKPSVIEALGLLVVSLAGVYAPGGAL